MSSKYASGCFIARRRQATLDVSSVSWRPSLLVPCTSGTYVYYEVLSKLIPEILLRAGRARYSLRVVTVGAQRNIPHGRANRNFRTSLFVRAEQTLILFQGDNKTGKAYTDEGFPVVAS
jgi:hypothetical protein